MKSIAISSLCAFTLLSALLLGLSEPVLSKSHTAKKQVADQNVTFQNQTNATLRDMSGELRSKLTQEDLKGIREQLRKVEEKSDETAFQMKVVMLIGGGIAFVLGVLVTRLFSRIIPDSGKPDLSITH